MRYSGRIHNKAMVAKSLLGHLLRSMGDLRYPENELLVVNYHSTPKKFIPALEKQIRFFEQHFDILSPADLQAYYTGNRKGGLFITFDDGLKNNLYAAELLGQLGHRAGFFVVPQYIDTPPKAQKQYYLRHIRPLVNTHIDSEPEDYEAMDWQDVRSLSAQGHLVGSHSYTHTMLASSAEATHEIVDSKAHIGEQLGTAVRAFCSINNTLLSVGPRDKQLIAENYNYHFTTLPGLNATEKNPLCIYRRNVECFWLNGAVYFALGKWDLRRWAAKIESYARL